MTSIIPFAIGAAAIFVFGAGWVCGYKSKKSTPCDSCEHLEKKGGGFWSYYCSAKGYTESFDKPPEYCKNFKPKQEAEN